MRNRKKSIVLALLVCGVAVAAGWPVNAAYDSSAEAVNVANIQSMGYHTWMTAGKVYKFEFSDGTEAYFMKLPGLSSYKFQQVTAADYNDNPGEEYQGQTNSTSSGAPSEGEADGSSSGGGGSSGGGNYVPGGLLAIGSGDNGNYCGAGTPYDCVYH